VTRASHDTNTVTVLNTPYLFCPACENKVLRVKFGRKGEEAMGGWGEIHSEELHHIYSQANILRGKRSIWEKLEVHRNFSGKT
jgi:hypothetical protein